MTKKRIHLMVTHTDILQLLVNVLPYTKMTMC